MLNHEDDVKGLLDLGDPLNHRFTIGLVWFSLIMFIKKCLMWMIWGYPHFRKPLYIYIYICVYIWGWVKTLVPSEPQNSW